MQKLYLGSRSLIPKLFLFICVTSALYFASITVRDLNRDLSIDNPSWENDMYFAQQAKILKAKIGPGTSQSEVDAILDEYEFISLFKAKKSEIWTIYGGETKVSAIYEVNLFGDPTNSGVHTYCTMEIIFREDSLGESRVDNVFESGSPKTRCEK